MKENKHVKFPFLAYHISGDMCDDYNLVLIIRRASAPYSVIGDYLGCYEDGINRYYTDKDLVRLYEREQS